MMLRFIRRVIMEVRGEIAARRDMRLLEAGIAHACDRIDLAILSGQMREGRRPRPLHQVLWRARRDQGPQFSPLIIR